MLPASCISLLSPVSTNKWLAASDPSQCARRPLMSNFVSQGAGSSDWSQLGTHVVKSAVLPGSNRTILCTAARCDALAAARKYTGPSRPTLQPASVATPAGMLAAPAGLQPPAAHSA